MRLLVCGSRDWSDRRIFGITLRGFLDRYGDELEIIEGCARGADSMAEEFAHQHGIPVHHYPADWNSYAPKDRWRAGHDRNRAMLERGRPDMVVAFKDTLSGDLRRGGTENMVRISKEVGVPVMVVGSGPALP